MNNSRKIYILISDLALGGAERVMLSLAQQFTKSHDVEFICLRKNGALLNGLPDNTPVHFLSAADASRLSLVIRGFLGIRKIFNANQASVVVSTGTGTNLLACTARMFSPKGASLVIREACSSKNSKSKIIAVLKRLLYPVAHGMIGVSNGVAEELKTLAGENQPVVSIPNPVDAHRLNTLAALSDGVLAAFPHPFMLTVGRLVPQKNTALLIDAYALLAAEIEPHLVILGGGPLEAQLQRQIAGYGLQEKIHLLGEVANPHPWYRKASMFVLSSDSEGYPNVLLEALAHGVSVVATDCDFGPRQILENGRYGCLVQPGNAGMLANAIRSSLAGRVGYESWDSSRFNETEIATRYLAFMESC